MIKRRCDFCDEALELPLGNHGTKLPVSEGSEWTLKHMDLCPNCWNDLATWVDQRIQFALRCKSDMVKH